GVRSDRAPFHLASPSVSHHRRPERSLYDVEARPLGQVPDAIILVDGRHGGALAVVRLRAFRRRALYLAAPLPSIGGGAAGNRLCTTATGALDSARAQPCDRVRRGRWKPWMVDLLIGVIRSRRRSRLS